MPLKILHLDLDAFFCAVEEQHDPTLQGKLFAVGGRPDQRGVVASCSYSARRYGVHSAMSMARAVRLCPELLIVPHRHGLYREVSREVMGCLHRLTPLVEQLSIDEAFLDVSDLPETGLELARRMQATIHAELSLPCSLGVATNKLVAKIATDVGKAAARAVGYPNAIQVVPPGQEAAFLAPLPVQALWGVGPKTAQTLAGLGIQTIGELSRWPEADLVERFGKAGHDLARRAYGLDERPVVTSREARSISQEITFAQDVRDEGTLLRTLRAHAEGVGRRMRQSNLAGTTVKLKLRWSDFTTLTRQTTLAQPTDQNDEIYAAARRLFGAVWRRRRSVRLLGVGVSGLGPPLRQLSLWDSGAEKERHLQAAIDELRERFGSDVIRRGSEVE